MAKLFPGDHPDIIAQNKKLLTGEGLSDGHATHLALKHAKKGKAVGRAIKGVTAKKKDKVPIK